MYCFLTKYTVVDEMLKFGGGHFSTDLRWQQKIELFCGG